MDDDINFCPRCGKNLAAGASYCPACGASMGDPNVQTREEIAMDAKNEGRINIAVWILVIGAAISIISGLIMIVTMGDMVHTVFEMIEDMMPGVYTEESLRSLLVMSFVISMVCASLGIVSALLAVKRRQWVFAIILGLVASFFGFIFSLIAVYLLYKAKAAFKD